MAKTYQWSFRPKRISVASAAGILLLASPPLGAEFTLNFSPNDNVTSNIANVHCTTGGGDGIVPGGGGGWGGWGGGGDGVNTGSGMQYYGCGQGYFIQEVIHDPDLGSYYHVIVGDPSVDEFAIEFYLSGDYNSDSGGDWSNARDPLSNNISSTGNGTGNPKRTYMYVINNDSSSGFSQEFYKAQQSQKPRITQNISSDTMQAEFSLDMTNSNYNQNNIVGDITNIITFSGADQGVVDFNMATDARDSYVTAGRYVYSSGGGWSGWDGTSWGGESSGSYSYVDGGYEVYKVNWHSLCNPDQNPDHHCDFNRSDGGWGGGGWSGGGW